ATQSLLDTSQTPAVAKKVDALAAALIAAIKKPTEYAAVTKAISHAQRYDTRDFIDLGDLAAQLAARCRTPAVKNGGRAGVAAIKNGLVAAEKHQGSRVAHSNGVAIYVPSPRGDTTVAYARLDLAKDTRWDQFLAAYKKA